MRETVERELKLEPGEGFVLPELGGESQPTRVFVSTYHDTPDLALARHGLTLRHRVEDGTGLWQLKLPRGLARAELEQAGPPARPPLELVGAPRRLPPRQGAGARRPAANAPAGRPCRRRRDRRRLRVGARRAARAAALPRARGRAGRWRRGDARTSRRRSSGGPAPSPATLRPKLYRALDLDVPADDAAVSKGTAPLAALGLALGEQARRLLVHDPGVRLGSDPEDLHQLRVATRRLRAFLRAGRPMLDRGVVGAAARRDRLAGEGSRSRAGPRRPRRAPPRRRGGCRRARGRAPRRARGRAGRGQGRRRRRALERPLPGAARTARRRVGASGRRRRDPAARHLEGGVEAHAESAFPARRRVRRRRPPRRPHPRQARPLRRGARGARARQAGQDVRRRSQGAPGRARRSIRTRPSPRSGSAPGRPAEATRRPRPCSWHERTHARRRAGGRGPTAWTALRQAAKQLG